MKYAFYLFAGKRGKYHLSPVSEGPAERAGVQAGDRLLSISGVMVSKLSHSALMKMVGLYGIYPFKICLRQNCCCFLFCFYFCLFFVHSSKSVNM